MTVYTYASEGLSKHSLSLLLLYCLRHGHDKPWKQEAGGRGGLPNVRYTGMCHRPGSIFHLQKSRTGPQIFEVLLQNRPYFLKFLLQNRILFWQSGLQRPGSNVKTSCFHLLFPAVWCLHFCFAKCFKLSILNWDQFESGHMYSSLNSTWFHHCG